MQVSVLAEVGVERHAAAAVDKAGLSIADAHDAAQQFAVGVACTVDSARDVKVLDGGTADALERRGKAALLAHVDGQCVAIAVEGAAEGMLLRVAGVSTGHCRHADVGIQPDELAAEVVRADAHQIGELGPVVQAVDDVGGCLRAFALLRPGAVAEDGLHLDVAPRHAEGIAARPVATDCYIIAVGVSGGDALHRRSLWRQRDGSAWIGTFVTGLHDARTLVADVDGVRIQYVPIHSPRLSPGKRVILVQIRCFAITGTFVDIILGIVANDLAVEDASTNETSVIVADQSTHAGIVVRHVARHAAIFHLPIASRF
ncbi:MAG: hypothetical protein IJV19_07545, partial [Prevotella sp.]|nr:hypothetical protein [Prevotella sp.]